MMTRRSRRWGLSVKEDVEALGTGIHEKVKVVGTGIDEEVEALGTIDDEEVEAVGTERRGGGRGAGGRASTRMSRCWGLSAD